MQAWRSVPGHLSRENKKFIFSDISAGARARDFKPSIEWLKLSGMAVMVSRVSKPEIPLSAYSDNIAFKLFLVDVGLLLAMMDVDASSILEGSELFNQFKGALTEQYVCQRLISSAQLNPYYWSSNNSQCEIDFMVQNKNSTYAIEVKAGVNVKSKNLKVFKQKYENVKTMRLSLLDYKEQDWVVNVPLYAIEGFVFA